MTKSTRRYTTDLNRSLAEITNKDNLALAQRFFTLKRGQGRKEWTLRIYSSWFSKLENATHGTPYPDLTEHQLSGFLATLRYQNAAPSSVLQASNYIKTFLAWVLDVDKLPRRLREALRTRDNPALPLGEVLRQHDLDTLLAATRRLRNQTILCVLWECGFRPSELIAINISSVHFKDDGGAWIHLPKDAPDLKTGPRSVTIQKYADMLRALIQTLPDPSNGSAPVFQSHSQRNKGGRLSYSALHENVKKCFAETDLERHSCHWFRHSAATRDSEAGYNERDLREKYGWGPTSKMPGLYVHHSKEHIERMARKSVGIDHDGQKPQRPPTQAEKDLRTMARLLTEYAGQTD